MENSIEIQLRSLTTQRDALIENIETITKEMNFSLSNLTKYKDLEKQSVEYFEILKKVEKEIEILESKINSSVRPNQQHTISQNLSKINFREAKTIVNHILEHCLGKEGGTALFLLQNTSLMRGDLCVADIQYSLSSKSYGRFKYCPIDPLGYISDERSLLNAIADYFKPVESHPNDQQYVQNIIDQISASVQGNSIVFFDFTNWDSLLENDDKLLSWFIQYFWHPLNEKHQEISQNYASVKFILFISLGSMASESYDHLSYCCNSEDFDSLKILKLPLQNWTEGDIDDWLQEIYGLSRKKSQELAKKIYKLSNPGIPVTVCSNLEKSLHKLLEA
jgi:inactive STAND/Effector-associated domain 9